MCSPGRVESKTPLIIIYPPARKKSKRLEVPNVILLGPPIQRRRVQHSALSISCACRGGKLQSRPDPVTWSARWDTVADKAGVGLQAASPPNRPARSPGRTRFLTAGRPAPADGPRRPPPSRTEASRARSALPASLSPYRGWSPRPLVASLPPFVAPLASFSSRFSTITSGGVAFTFGASGEEVSVASAMCPHQTSPDSPFAAATNP